VWAERLDIPVKLALLGAIIAWFCTFWWAPPILKAIVALIYASCAILEAIVDKKLDFPWWWIALLITIAALCLTLALHDLGVI